MALAPISARTGHVAMWAGSEMLVWGGEALPGDTQTDAAGAAYDPEADEWRVLPDAPIDMRRAPISGFTGTEMLIWGGLGRGDTPVSDGAAYSIATDSWRPLAPSPLAGGAGYVSAWTGTEWLVVEAGTEVAPESASGEAAAYDPSTDTWRSIADATMPPGWAAASAWTGDTLVIVRVASEGETGGAQYDPVANVWTAIPLNASLTIETLPTATWTGHELLMVRAPIHTSAGLEEGSGAFLYDPSRQRWRRTIGPPLPLIQQAPVWTGEDLVYYTPRGGMGLTFSPTDEQWSIFPSQGDRDREFWSSVWSGEELLIWGGSDPRSATVRPDGVVVRIGT